MRIPTVMIESDNGPVSINQKDFDPATMKLYYGGEVPPMPPSVVPAGPAAIDANNNPVSPTDGGQFVAPAAVQQPAQAGEPTKPENAADNAPKQLLVTKKGKKVIVVDETGKPVERDGIDKAGYADEAAAWAAIMALSAS